MSELRPTGRGVTGYVSPHRHRNAGFPQPENGAVKVWRYMGLPALVNILANRHLPFIRVDLFEDPFEDSAPSSLASAFTDPVARDQHVAGSLAARKQAFVSCWHENQHESEAMWRLYCTPREGIALQTTYEKLDASLPHDRDTAAAGEPVFLGRVSYRDHAEWDLKVPFNRFALLMHKRLAFAHEHEVRAVVLANAPITVTGHRDTLKVEAADMPEAKFVAWDANAVLDHVYVSPYAKGWYRDAVVAVLHRFAPPLLGRLCPSSMCAAPNF